MFTPLLQSMQTLWNWALGLDIVGTIFFFFIAYNDWFSSLVVFINIVCVLSNLLWAKMFMDLHRSEMTINFFFVLAGISVISTIFACRAKRRPSEAETEDVSDDEYEYVYESDDADEDTKNKKN